MDSGCDLGSSKLIGRDRVARVSKGQRCATIMQRACNSNSTFGVEGD